MPSIRKGNNIRNKSNGDLKLLKDAFQNLYERDGNKGLEYFDKATIIYELQNQPLKAAETQYKKGLGCWTAVCMT